MAIRPRNAPPPYQVMKAHPPAMGSSAAGDSTPGSAVPSAGGAGRWWTSASGPLLLRLPRGFIVVAALAVALLLVVAYWVGWSRGYQQGVSQIASGASAGAPPWGAAAPLGPEPSPAARPPVPARPALAPAPPIRPGASASDNRVRGLNYFVANLVGADEATARNVVEFLWQEGVEAQAVRLHNRGLFKVVALRGFSKEELASPAYTQYDQLLKRVARLWKAQNPRSVDLTGMYAERYDGEAVDLVILRGNPP